MPLNGNEAPSIEMMTPFQAELMKIHDSGYGKLITAEAGTEPFCGIILPCNTASSKHVWMFSDGSVMVTQPGDQKLDVYIDTTENTSSEFKIDRRNGPIASDASLYIDYLHSSGEIVDTIRELMSSQYAYTTEQQNMILTAVKEAKQLIAEGYRPLSKNERRDNIASSVLDILKNQ